MTNSTERRVPRITGLPARIAGSRTMRSWVAVSIWLFLITIVPDRVRPEYGDPSTSRRDLRFQRLGHLRRGLAAKRRADVTSGLGDGVEVYAVPYSVPDPQIDHIICADID